MFNVISDFEMIIQNLKINKNCGGGLILTRELFHMAWPAR